MGSYPLVLDESVPGTEERYEQRRGRLYLGEYLTLSRSCKVGASSVVGSRVAIDDMTTIQNSVIGPGTRIGKNCTITNSYMANDVVVDDGCVITDSILAEGASIGKMSTLTAGTLIGRAVVLGQGATLKHQRVATEPWDDAQSQPSDLGQGGEGYIWPTEEAAAAEDEDSDDEDAVDPRNIRISDLSASSDPGSGSEGEDGSMSDASDSSAPPAI